jgi:hypothetical protein
VLTAAAALKLLTPEEERMAYAFSSRVAARYVDFWLDSGTGSVNLWDHGRKTDAYRGKHRILGENLSLSHQFFYTNALWNRLGWRNSAPDAGFAAWLDTLPRSTTTWFSRGEVDRLLVTYRDGGRLIGLPLINGAAGQHMHTPYFPAPYSPGVLAGAADATYPQLLPRFTLSDGSVLQPLAYFTKVRVQTDGDVTRITYDTPALDRMGDNAPQRDPRVSVRTTFELFPGGVRRQDVAVARRGVKIDHVDLVFANFSAGAAPTSDGGLRFQRGEVEIFAADNMECEATPAPGAPYQTPVGPLRSVVSCRTDAPGTTWRGGWTLRFRAD